ncbi:MAG: hypothetical protein WAW02_08375 [Sideroxyarcus sp.]
MAKLVFISFAAMFLVAILVLLALKMDLALKIVLIVCAALALVFLFYIDHFREQAHRMAKFDSKERRVEELLKKSSEPNSIIEIRGSSVGYGFTLLLVAAIGCFVVVMWEIQGNRILLIAGLIIAAFGLVKLVAHIAPRNKLQLTISQQGIAIRNGTCIDWKEIEDVNLITVRGRTSPYYHVLFFTLVDSLPNRENLSLIAKMLRHIGLNRKIAKSVVLGSNNEDPEVVYRVSKTLWQSSRHA